MIYGIKTAIGILGCISLFIIPGYTAEHSYSLTTTGGKITFSDQERIVSVSALETAIPGLQQVWIDPQPKVPLWRITVLDSVGIHQTVTALDGPGTIKQVSPKQLIIEWTGLKPGDLRVKATVTAQETDIEWEMEWEVRASGFALWDVIYPEIGPLAHVDQVHSIVPYGWGVLHHDLLNRRDDDVYPSASRAMPFVAVSDGKSGIYLGVHDSSGYPIRSFVGKSETLGAAGLGIRHDVEGMGQVTRYRIPYKVTMTPYLGDWYESARIYRRAAMITPWGKIPPLSERKDIPKWLLDTDLWYLGSCEDEATANQAIAFAKYFAVPVSAHIYQWHQIPFDDHYPEYFPAKPGFKDAVRKVQEAGIAVMPYINGRLWDSRTDSWKIKNAEKSCAINENGDKYVEIYGSKVPLSPMCPFTNLWQEMVMNLVSRLANEVGVKGIYIDQISAASAKRCFAANHGHPIGGGTYWIQGYRTLLRRCLQRIPPDTVLTTEENADPWNDLLHAWLMVNTQERGGELVPLYPAVYGGRAVSFGFQYLSGNDFTYRYPFRLKMARALVYGSQLGWVGYSVLDEANKNEAVFFKKLCLARHENRDALQFGELLSPIVLEASGTVSWTEKTGELETQQVQPAVFTTAWLTPDGKRKVVVVNISDEEQTITMKLNQRHFKSAKNAAVRLLSSDGKTGIPLQKDEQNQWQGELKLAATSVSVYEVKEK